AAQPRAGTDVGARLVLVAYADWRRAESLAPARVVAVAAVVGAAGVLLDTVNEGVPLFAIEPLASLAAWVAAAHAARLFAALAGGLSGSDFVRARALGADLVGVRGAACVGGRTGRVSRARVAALRALTGAAAPPAPPAPPPPPPPPGGPGGRGRPSPPGVALSEVVPPGEWMLPAVRGRGVGRRGGERARVWGRRLCPDP